MSRRKLAKVQTLDHFVESAFPAAVEKVPGTKEGAPHSSIAGMTHSMASGNEEAFTEFFQAYFHRLFRYLLSVTGGDEHAAKEALQETLIRVARHVRRFDEEHAFWNWLTVVARNAARDGCRKRFRYGDMLRRFLGFQSTQAEDPSPSEPKTTERLVTPVQEVLSNFPELERRLIEGKYWEGLSVRELALELHLTEKAVESRLLRARQKLREALNKHFRNETPK